MQKLKLQKFKQYIRKRWPFCLLIILTFTAVLAFQPPAQACAGWLCGVREKLNGTEGWKNGKVLWDLLFVGIQALIALLFGIVGLIGVIKARADEAYKDYFLFLLLVFLALLASNYGASYIMGGEQGGAASILIKSLVG
jgi:hypothetical protein